MRKLPVGTYHCFRTQRTLVVAPLYRGVPTPVTRESLQKFNDTQADTGGRVYRHPRTGQLLLALALVVGLAGCDTPTAPAETCTPWVIDSVWVYYPTLGDSAKVEVKTRRCLGV